MYENVVQYGKTSYYWIDWKQGLVQIGRGSYPRNVLLEWQDPLPKRISLLEFRGDVDMVEPIEMMGRLALPPVQDYTTRWQFKKAPGINLMLCTSKYC